MHRRPGVTQVVEVDTSPLIRIRSPERSRGRASDSTALRPAFDPLVIGTFLNLSAYSPVDRQIRAGFLEASGAELLRPMGLSPVSGPPAPTVSASSASAADARTTSSRPVSLKCIG